MLRKTTKRSGKRRKLRKVKGCSTNELNLSQFWKNRKILGPPTQRNHVRVSSKYIDEVNVPGYRGWLLKMFFKKLTGRNSNIFSLRNFK